MEGTLKVFMLVVAAASVLECSPVIQRVTKKTDQGSIMLPSAEVKVLTELTKYFSTFTEDLLSYRNGHMTKTELQRKYTKKPKAFPKRLMGLVSSIHSYYLKNLNEIAPPLVIENPKPANQTSISTGKMKDVESVCHTDFCASNPPHCWIFLFEDPCWDFCMSTSWTCPFSG